MSKRSKKRRKPKKAKRKNHSAKVPVARSAPPKAPSLAAKDLPSPTTPTVKPDQGKHSVKPEEEPILKPAQASKPVSRRDSALVNIDEDMGLNIEGIGLLDPRETRIEYFGMVPHAAGAARATEQEDEKVARIDLEKLVPGIEIPEPQDEAPSSLVDFLETPSPPRVRRVQFLPEDHIEEPRYFPDELLAEEGAENTSVEHSKVWGKSQVDTPSFKEFDESEAIREGLRSVPIVGKTIISEQLRVRRRAWKCIGIVAVTGAFAWGISTVKKGVKHSETSGSTEVPSNALGLYEPAAIHSIDELLTRYFSAKTITERLSYVRAAMHVQPIMEAYELENGPQIYTGFTRDTVKAPAPYLDTAYFTVDVTLDPTLEKRRLVIERSDENTYLLDWENLVGYQKMSWDVFTETRPTEPQVFHAVVLPSDYHNYGFSNPREWMSWRLRHPANPDLDLYGYTRVDSEMTSQFLRETSIRLNAPDTGTAVTLRLAYPEGASEIGKSQVEILEIVKRGWITTYE